MPKLKKRSYRRRMPDGTIKTCITRKYYGWVGGRSVPLCADKAASEAALNDMRRRLERSGVGIIDPKVQTRPIAEHVDDFMADLEARRRSADYCRILRLWIDRIVRECGWTTLRSVTADSVISWINRAVQQQVAPKTIRNMIGAVGSFCAWAVKRSRMYANPIAGVELPRVDGDVRRQRRALTLEEIDRLLDVAGPRRMIYWTALTTGLRRSELKSLQWGDVRIGNVPAPYIQLRAIATKSRRADSIPLRADVADALVAARPTDWRSTDRVFKAIPGIDTFKRDLQRADIPFIDDAGRRVDLHALRHSYCSHLAAAGVNPREAMGLMRHTDMRLTAQVYTDDRLLPLRSAVERLPAFRGAPEQAVETTNEQANGTDGRVVASVHDGPGAARNVRGAPVFSGLSVSACRESHAARKSLQRPQLTPHVAACLNRKKTPRVGFEPTTYRLTAGRSTIELSGILAAGWPRRGATWGRVESTAPLLSDFRSRFLRFGRSAEARVPTPEPYDPIRPAPGVKSSRSAAAMSAFKKGYANSQQTVVRPWSVQFIARTVIPTLPCSHPFPASSNRAVTFPTNHLAYRPIQGRFIDTRRPQSTAPPPTSGGIRLIAVVARFPQHASDVDAVAESVTCDPSGYS